MKISPLNTRLKVWYRPNNNNHSVSWLCKERNEFTKKQISSNSYRLFSAERWRMDILWDFDHKDRRKRQQWSTWAILCSTWVGESWFVLNFQFVFNHNQFFEVVLLAWTILYTSMGFASWRVWSKGGGFSGKARNSLLIYIAKLFLNWMWPLIVFGLGSLLGAIIEMSVLLVFVVVTGALFYRFDKLAGLLFIPYFGYLSFATVLCIHIYILNNWKTQNKILKVKKFNSLLCDA